MSSEPAESVDDENHIVGCDLQKLDDEGNPIEGEVSRDLKIYLKRPNVNPELKAMLLNTRVGDSFRIDLPTGENESMIHYEVTVKDINRTVIPEHGDELARTVIGDPTVGFEDLREMVRANIESAYEGRYSRYFRDDLINALLQGYSFDVPEVLVAQAMNSFVEDVKTGPKKELPPDFDREKFEIEMRPMAEQTVRWALVRDRIIETEELQAEEPDFEGLADMEAQRTGIEYETLLKYFKNAPEVKDKILSEKAIQLLEDYAVVQEIEDLELATAEPPDGSAFGEREPRESEPDASEADGSGTEEPAAEQEG
jgi:FKBP-type peptidyl-prolyl cis-trans isomerase (trigger factor)